MKNETTVFLFFSLFFVFCTIVAEAQKVPSQSGCNTYRRLAEESFKTGSLKEASRLTLRYRSGRCHVQ